MRGLGTVINVGCILVGGVCGLAFGSRLKERMRETLMAAAGVAVLFLGLSGALEYMLAVVDGSLSTQGSMLMIGSLAIGAVVGELLDIEGGVERFGEWLKHKSNSAGDNLFVSSFVSTSCTVCIGAMAVVGSIEDAMYGDYSILLAKGILDAIIVCIMTASQGKGCIFSAIPVGVFQGLVTVLALFTGPFLTEPALARLSFVGSILIFCVGLNLILPQKKIRVANLLPSIVVAALWGPF